METLSRLGGIHETQLQCQLGLTDSEGWQHLYSQWDKVVAARGRRGKQWMSMLDVSTTGIHNAP